MIVVSILTALALEHLVQTLHHRHEAHEAAEKMDAELRFNVKEVDKVLAHNEAKRQQLAAMRAQLLDGIRAKAGDAELMARFDSDWKKNMGLSLKTPSLRREAWEAAVASQAVTWMPRDQLERYATVYGAMRDQTALFNGGMIGFLDGPHMRDVMSDIQMGLSNPKAVYRVASQMESTYGSFDGNLEMLKRQLQEATGTPATVPAGGAH